MKRLVHLTWMFLVACGGVSGGDGGDAGSDGAAQDGQQSDGPVDGQGGGAGGALSFDGTDDLVFVPTSDVFNAPTAMTIEAWVRLEDGLDGAVASIWGQGGAADKIILQVVQGELQVKIIRDGIAGQTVAAAQLDINGQWAHVATTYDGSALLVYIDGVQKGQTAAAGNLVVPNQPLRFGIEDILNGTQTFLAGEMDEVRIWDHARTGQEIADNFNRVIAANSPGLIAYYQFNEDSGQQVLDSTANGLNGTLGADAASGADDPARVTSDAPVN